jgi:hypothetical protein
MTAAAYDSSSIENTPVTHDGGRIIQHVEIRDLFRKAHCPCLKATWRQYCIQTDLIDGEERTPGNA